MIITFDSKAFKEKFDELLKQYGNHKDAMYRTFRDCFKYYFWECCEWWEDVRPYVLTEQEIEDLFFKATVDACDNYIKKNGMVGF